jgi:hypothetical protein
MPLKPKTAVRIEVAGLVLVLLSLGWQLFIEEPIAGIYSGAKEYEVNERLELVWGYLQALREEVVEHRQPGGRDYNYLQGQWNRLAAQKDVVANQADIARTVRVALFILGSVMLAIGRYYELQQRVSST